MKRNQFFFLVLMFCLLFFTNGYAQKPVLVKDIYPGPSSAEVGPMVELNNLIIFSAKEGKTGRELWKSDGTEIGTVMIKDVNPGVKDGVTTPLTVFKGNAYFWASDGVNGEEIWRTDGTAAGTSLFYESIKGLKGSTDYYTSFFEFKGELYFNTKTSDGQKVALFKTNGSTISLIKEFVRLDDQFMVTDDLIFFQGGEKSQDLKPFKSDGTSSGTSVFSIPEAGSVRYLASTGDKIFFDNLEDRLMVSNSKGGDVVVLNDSIGWSKGNVIINKKLYLFYNKSIWESDGTVKGTHPVGEKIDVDNIDFTEMHAYKNKLYYTSTRQPYYAFMQIFDPAKGETTFVDGNMAGAITFFNPDGKYLYWYSGGLPNYDIRYTDGTNYVDLYSGTIYGVGNTISFGGFLYVTNPSEQNENQAYGYGELLKIQLSDPSFKCNGFRADMLFSGPMDLPCAKGFVDLAVTVSGGVPPYSYEWKRDGAYIGTNSDMLRATIAGKYYSVVTDSQGCVAPGPVANLTSDAPIIFIIGNKSICSGRATKLTLSVSGNKPHTHQWKQGDTVLGSSDTLLVSKPGVYTLIVKSEGCQITASATIVETANLPVTITGDDSFCEGKTTRLTAKVSEDISSLIFQWKLNGNIVGTNSNTYVAGTAGNYSVSVIDSKGCNGNSQTLSVTSKPSPVVTITANGAKEFLAGGSVVLSVPSASGQTYQWSKNNNVISGATNYSYTVNEEGTYAVTVTLNGCSATSEPSIVSQILGNEPAYDDGFELTASPNPTSGEALITFKLPKPGQAQISLYDVSGRRILLHNSFSVSAIHNVPLNLQDISAGTYIIKAEDLGSSKAITIKILKK